MTPGQGRSGGCLEPAGYAHVGNGNRSGPSMNQASAPQANSCMLGDHTFTYVPGKVYHVRTNTQRRVNVCSASKNQTISIKRQASREASCPRFSAT